IRLGDVDADVRRDAVAVATQADPTSRMTFVKSFGDELEVTLSQSLRTGDAQTWIVDYLPIPRVNLRLVSQDDSLRSYEMRHDVVFGVAPTAVRGDRPAREERSVSAVTIEGMLAVPEAELRRALRLTPGDTFDSALWQIDRDRLEGMLERAGHLEARVTSRTVESAGSVALTYHVESGPRTTLEVSGDAVGSSVTDAITQAWAESISDDVLRDEVRDLVARELAREGYLQAQVDVSMRSTEGEKTLA